MPSFWKAVDLKFRQTNTLRLDHLWLPLIQWHTLIVVKFLMNQEVVMTVASVIKSYSAINRKRAVTTRL